MTDSQKPAQDTPAPKAHKIPSIKPPKSTAEIIGRTIADCFFGGLAYLAARGHIMSGDVFTLIICALCGIRLSDIATLRKSNSNSDPPIAGGLTGGLLAMLGSIADVFRPHG